MPPWSGAAPGWAANLRLIRFGTCDAALGRPLASGGHVAFRFVFRPHFTSVDQQAFEKARHTFVPPVRSADVPQHNLPGLGDDEGGWNPLRLKPLGWFAP